MLGDSLSLAALREPSSLASDWLRMEGVREFEVGRIKRSADPAPNNDSSPNETQCRIGVAALLDAVDGRMPTSRDTDVPVTIE